MIDGKLHKNLEEQKEKLKEAGAGVGSPLLF
jgi:hypothetical protein